jgi:hypothetical protein
MVENLFETTPLISFQYRWGLIGAVPAVICSWLSKRQHTRCGLSEQCEPSSVHDSFGSKRVASPLLVDVRFSGNLGSSSRSFLAAKQGGRDCIKGLLTRRKIGPTYFQDMCRRALGGPLGQVPPEGKFFERRA